MSLPDDISFIPPHRTGLNYISSKLAFTWRQLKALADHEIDHGIIFLTIPVFMTVGAVIYFCLPYEPEGSRLCGYFVVITGLFVLLRHYRPAFFIAAMVVCIVLGAVFAKVETWRMATPMLGSDVSTVLTGRVVSGEKTVKGKSRLIIDVMMTENPSLKYPPQRVKLTVLTNNGVDFKPGDGIHGRVKLRASSGPIRPGSFDFSFYNYFQSIGAQGYFLGKAKHIIVSPPHFIVDRLGLAVSRLRLAMTAKITNAISGETGSVASALITGDRGGISSQTNEALRIAGLAHILSISGLHMAMVSGMVLIVVRTLLAFFPGFSSAYPSKKIAAAIALIVAAFYLLLSGADVAAQRSFIMVAVMLVAILFDRSAITMRNLAIAALITLILEPHEVLGPSFQMSFSATAVLIAVFGWWTRKHYAYQKTVPKFVGAGIVYFILFPLISTAVASLVAGLSSGIFAAYHFANTAPLGIISNAIAFPVMSIAVMPFALLSAVAMPFGLEWWPLQIMGWGVKIVEQIAYSVASISPDLNPGMMPRGALIFLSFGLVILVCCRTRLCLISVFFFLLGILIALLQKPPALLVSEDARAVGFVDNRTLFIGEVKPSKFTTDVWKRSYRLVNIVGPVRQGEQKGAQFGCSDGICSAEQKGGLKVAVIENGNGSELTCSDADIVVLLANVPLKNRDFRNEQPTGCSEQQLITPRDLALKGSAAVSRAGNVVFAIKGGPARPWNRQRIYLRAARN
ncbi:ComEC/Rec2 family competence protein [uncultured Bartonella sp.]|uniref:ComEC/Rec2 family competence protein n=1 Tax=uncultured Bartonella sp. TaxID=104108 RepID=UPI0026312505|nr:ComEC/Rec2 family competence protein [uncultured Bartonella sp.]